eukprot:scaffold91542_cov48-Attheya_sp.AAC.8
MNFIVKWYEYSEKRPLFFRKAHPRAPPREVAQFAWWTSFATHQCHRVVEESMFGWDSDKCLDWHRQ